MYTTIDSANNICCLILLMFLSIDSVLDAYFIVLCFTLHFLAFCALTLLVGQQEEHPAPKN